MSKAVFTQLAMVVSLAVACGSSQDAGSSSGSGGPDRPGGDGPGGGTPTGPIQGVPGHVPTDCPNAVRDGYSILDDKTYGTYQIRKVGDVKFRRVEKDANGNETEVSEDYQVVTALPKKYLVSEAHQGKTFPMEDHGEYWAVDSNYAIPNIPCVTDDLMYAPIVTGFNQPTVTVNGRNKGWPIQEDIAAEVALYNGPNSRNPNKMWVYNTWPGYRYGDWFRDEAGIRPTWLFKKNAGGGVSFEKFSPQKADWPVGPWDINYGLHIDPAGKVYIPKPQPIEFTQRNNRPPPPNDLRLAYKDWDDELRCVVINKSSAIIASTRTIFPGGSEAYYPAESYLPGYAVVGQDSDRYWGLKGREVDEASWWPGDDCFDGMGGCGGQSRMLYRNGCSIDGYDIGQGDGFNTIELKNYMASIGVIIPREQMYRIQIYQQDKPDQPARLRTELYYEQDEQGRWQPRMRAGTFAPNLGGLPNSPRYTVNGHIWPGQRIFAVLLDQ